MTASTLFFILEHCSVGLPLLPYETRALHMLYTFLLSKYGRILLFEISLAATYCSSHDLIPPLAVIIILDAACWNSFAAGCYALH